MHSTEHKRECCALMPWELRNADRICEHGDTRLLKAIKQKAKKARRRIGRQEEE